MAFRVLFLWSAISFIFANEVVFEPKSPAKPLRFCKAFQLFLDHTQLDSNYVEITHWKGLRFDLRYASFNNVTGHDLYCGSSRVFLHREAAHKLKKAMKLLEKEKPGHSFLIFDALRPLYAQEELKKLVRGTPFSHFVSNPGSGSVHNFGLAVDLSIVDPLGNPLDMGTDFDSFEASAGKSGEAAALLSGKLQEIQVEHRELLRSLMIRAGFIPLPSEWWHFNAYPSKAVRENYKKVPL